MKDLIKEYFQRDLNDGESAELRALLASSPEAAERFAHSMEKHYRHLGLPNPVWSGKPFPYHLLKTALWPKLAALLLVLGAGAWIGHRFLPAFTTPAPSVPAAPASQPPTPTPPRYQKLSVDLELPTSGLVTVRVMDGQGEEVKMLFAGVLPAGKKDFIWDGRKTDGAPADPGTYFIQVRSGQNVMRREVRLKAD